MKKEHFMLVVNKYGSAYLFTDRSTFSPYDEGTFEEWRAEAAKAYSPELDTPTPHSSWEKEFDELPLAVAYKQNGTKIVDFDYLKEQMDEIVKPFIRTLLTQKDKEIAEAEQKGRNKAADYLDMMLSADMPYTQGELDMFLREARDPLT